LVSYDADPIGALTAAMRIVLNMPDATWESLVAAAPIDPYLRQRLLSGDESSLDRMAARLNEHRSFDQDPADPPLSRPPYR
jgi:hypothetical protein